MALAVGDQRGLEVGGTDGAEIFDPARKLQGALDIVARGFEVPLALPAARAPREDVRLEGVAGQPGTLGESERLVEERERRRDAVQLIAATREPKQDVSPLDIRERLRLRDRACLVEQPDRASVVTDAHL